MVGAAFERADTAVQPGAVNDQRTGFVAIIFSPHKHFDGSLELFREMTIG